MRFVKMFAYALTLWGLACACSENTTGNRQDTCIPELLTPAAEDTLDNGCDSLAEMTIWDFDWTDCPSASEYAIYVMGARAQFPVINTTVRESFYDHESPGYVVEPNRSGWIWKVRAKIDGEWREWSVTKVFHVEPLNTDCP
jgi:hypothetical protein